MVFDVDLKTVPKHHYMLHLPEMLLRVGFLLSTFTHERKHKLVKLYTRDRDNLRSWDVGAIEDITAHQMWELGRSVFMSDHTSDPSPLALIQLRELFPTTPPNSFTTHTQVKCNGGSCSPGDVVAVFVDSSHLQVGELLIVVGVGDGVIVAILSTWEAIGDIDDIGWRQYRTSERQLVKMPADSIDTVLLYSMSKDHATCMVYLPYELRGV